MGKLATLFLILVAVAAFVVLNWIDPEPSRTCPTCGTTTLAVVRSSVGGPTLLRCTTCGREVIVHG